MKVECNLFPFAPEEIRLFHNREKCVKWCERKFGEKPPISDSEAQTITCGDVSVVLMESCANDVWDCALLCHEAYHIVCNHLREIGESSAGEEVMAYMVQCVSGALMDAHMRWKEKRCR